MALRIREVNGKCVALCAACYVAEPGDLYLDDRIHTAITEKYLDAWKESGLIGTDDGVQSAVISALTTALRTAMVRAGAKDADTRIANFIEKVKSGHAKCGGIWGVAQ